MSGVNINELVKRLRWAPNSLETQAADVIEYLRQQLEDIPEGCTVADAKKLREANHALAIENFELKKKLEVAMLLAAPKL